MDLDVDARPDNLDSKNATSSPSTQSELSTDGDASISQYSMLGTDKATNSVSEPKTKKRRKQSKPIKCQNVTSTTHDMQVEDVDVSKMEYQEVEMKEKSPDPVTADKLDQKTQKSAEDTLNNNDQSPEIASQKNILSSLNAMFYANSKMWGNDLANKGKNSLQLLGEMSGQEWPEEGQYNFDPKNFFQSFYPQMPPLLPLNPNDLSGELSKLSSVFSQFSDLPTQLNQTSFAPTQSNRSFVTANGVRVFNPEAYCELCEKEFCNKYFLKTHKANKHGVCSIDNGSSPYRAAFKPALMSPIVSQSLGQINENGTHSAADAYCNICQKSFCNKYFLKKHRQNIHGIAENGNDNSFTNLPSSIHVPVISSLQTNRSADLKSEENSSDHSGNEDQKLYDLALGNLKNKLNGNLIVPYLNMNGINSWNSSVKGSKVTKQPDSSERFLCELCNIEFCDKHYLDIHKHNRHSVSSSSPKQDQSFPQFSEIGKIEKTGKLLEEVDKSKNQMCVPCIRNFPNPESFQNHMLEMHSAGTADENGIVKDNEKNSAAKDVAKNSENETSNGSTDLGFYCSLCFGKFKDKDSLHSHFEMCHKSNVTMNGSANLKESCVVAVPALHQPDSEQQCDACPIKFFDKYLLASHRLKVHGIISPMADSSPQNQDLEMVRAIVSDYAFLLNEKGQISTVQSFCRICNKELCNKYFMKTHMWKMHGIDLDKLYSEHGASSASSFQCEICSKGFSDRSLLNIHKLNVHGMVEQQEPLESGIMKEENAFLKGNGYGQPTSVKGYPLPGKEKLFSCDICSQEFQSKLLLQMHLINKHVNNCESGIMSFGGLLGLSVPDSDQNVPGLGKQNGNFKENIEKDIPCSCCSLISSGEDKTLLCYVCNVSYPHGEHYQHHLTHRDLIESEMKSQVSSYKFKTSLDMNHRNKMRPRKIKRFRCSKCDKSFRTKNRCLHHIQVVHKSRKLLGMPPTADPQHDIHGRKPLTNHFVPKTSSDDPSTTSHANSINNNNILPKLPPLKINEKNSVFKDGCQQSLPVPYVLPKHAKDVIMQPFHLTEPSTEGLSKPDIFVSSLVYLPVSKKVSSPVTVSFTLTPA